MDMRVKLLLPLLLLALLIAPGSAFAQAESTPPQVALYLFWGDGCPHCHAERVYLEELSERYPQLVVREYEIYYNEQNRAYLYQMLAVHNVEPTGVPATFIGDRYWIGFSDGVAAQLRTKIDACLESACSDPGVGIIPGIVPIETTATFPATGSTVLSPDEEVISVPLIGEVSLAGHSLWFSTTLIALVDGFNPCSLWVLSVLLALVIHSGSRKKTMIVGLTFLIVASGAYGLFIIGIFSVFSVVSFLGWIQVAVALVALTFALINIKDYFWYKEGVSLTIADKHKPKIYRDMRGVLSEDRSTLALISATAVMALGVTTVELLCTAGFPVLWSNLMTTHDVPLLTFALLLALYLLIYLLDELFIFGSVVFTLKASKLEEKQGRFLKLVGGMVMLALAIVMLVDPNMMNNVGSSLLVFGGALLAAGIILVLHRRVLPQYGVYIGTEIAPEMPGASRRKSRASSR
jgi:thiol-disulfide isomerase/thioredoxin/uncharacterized membrane protein HdeD (DUF308 family)